MINYGYKIDRKKINHLKEYLKSLNNNERIHELEQTKSFDLLTDKELETIEKTISENNKSDNKNYIEYLNSRKTKKITIEIEQYFDLKVMGIGKNIERLVYTVSVEKL